MKQSNPILMSIGEVAKTLNITRKIILNYETKGLILPDKKEGTTGNRYYTADSIVRIRTVRTLQKLGLSLDEIHQYYSGDTNLIPLINRLEKLRDELSLNIEKLKERAKTENDLKIQFITIPEQTIYSKTIQSNTIEAKTSILRDTFMEAIKYYGSDTGKLLLFIEHPINNPNEVSYCIVVPSNSTGENIFHLREEKALCIYHHGEYETIPSTRENLIAYAKENNIKLTGICREFFLEGPPHHTDPKNFITQIALIIE